MEVQMKKANYSHCFRSTENKIYHYNFALSLSKYIVTLWADIYVCQIIKDFDTYVHAYSKYHISGHSVFFSQ